MITEHPRHQTYLPGQVWLSAACHRAPILTSHRVTRIIGSRRVEAVEVTDVQTGAAHRIPCDTVVFTGDWVPDHELARRGGLVIDPATRGPRVVSGICARPRAACSPPAIWCTRPRRPTSRPWAGVTRHAPSTPFCKPISGQNERRSRLPCAAPIHWVSPSAIRVDALPPARPLHLARPVMPRSRRADCAPGPPRHVARRASTPDADAAVRTLDAGSATSTRTASRSRSASWVSSRRSPGAGNARGRARSEWEVHVSAGRTRPRTHVDCGGLTDRHSGDAPPVTCRGLP